MKKITLSKKSKIIVLIVGLIFLVVVAFFILSGKARTDVVLSDYVISSNGKKMTLKVTVTSSAGYIRKMKRTRGSANYYFTFYSTYGINSKIGAEDTFIIDISDDVDEIYFYTGDHGYNKVLERTENKEWTRPITNKTINNIKKVSAEIFDISESGATIVIKDNNKKPYIYGEWYKIEKEENGKWVAVKTIIDNYGFNTVGYQVGENREVKLVINWEWLYGKLPEGSYRILKQVEDSYLAIPFNIATTS